MDWGEETTLEDDNEIPILYIHSPTDESAQYLKGLFNTSVLSILALAAGLGCVIMHFARRGNGNVLEPANNVQGEDQGNNANANECPQNEPEPEPPTAAAALLLGPYSKRLDLGDGLTVVLTNKPIILQNTNIVREMWRDNPDFGVSQCGLPKSFNPTNPPPPPSSNNPRPNSSRGDIGTSMRHSSYPSEAPGSLVGAEYDLAFGLRSRQPHHPLTIYVGNNDNMTMSDLQRYGRRDFSVTPTLIVNQRQLNSFDNGHHYQHQTSSRDYGYYNYY